MGTMKGAGELFLNITRGSPGTVSSSKTWLVKYAEFILVHFLLSEVLVLVFSIY